MFKYYTGKYIGKKIKSTHKKKTPSPPNLPSYSLAHIVIL